MFTGACLPSDGVYPHKASNSLLLQHSTPDISRTGNHGLALQMAEISRVLQPGGVFVASTFLKAAAPLGDSTCRQYTNNVCAQSCML